MRARHAEHARLGLETAFREDARALRARVHPFGRWRLEVGYRDTLDALPMMVRYSRSSCALGRRAAASAASPRCARASCRRYLPAAGGYRGAGKLTTRYRVRPPAVRSSCALRSAMRCRRARVLEWACAGAAAGTCVRCPAFRPDFSIALSTERSVRTTSKSHTRAGALVAGRRGAQQLRLCGLLRRAARSSCSSWVLRRCRLVVPCAWSA